MTKTIEAEVILTGTEPFVGVPGLVDSSAILWLLATGRGVRTKVENTMCAAAVRAMLGRRNVQPDADGSFSTADRDDAARLDAVAGSEFLDDRIRLREWPMSS